MNAKNFTGSAHSSGTGLILLVGALFTSVAAAWFASEFGPVTCDTLTFAAALDRIPIVLNLAIFAATIFATTAACDRMGRPEAPPLSMTWLIFWVPVGAGCVGLPLLFLQVPQHVWSDFAQCAAELGGSEIAIHAAVVGAHLLGWFLTLLLGAWNTQRVRRIAT